MTNPDTFRIMGIDPGSRITGFGILEVPRGVVNLKRVQLVAVGVIRSKTTLARSERTGYLHEAVHQLAGQYQPAVCVIERAFTGVNPYSALRLGETRGAVIAAVRRLLIEVAEITPTEVKKTITGQGHATKEQNSSLCPSSTPSSVFCNSTLCPSSAPSTVFCNSSLCPSSTPSSVFCNSTLCPSSAPQHRILQFQPLPLFPSIFLFPFAMMPMQSYGRPP